MLRMLPSKCIMSLYVFNKYERARPLAGVIDFCNTRSLLYARVAHVRHHLGKLDATIHRPTRSGPPAGLSLTCENWVRTTLLFRLQ
jgi:hypothetical protein